MGLFGNTGLDQLPQIAPAVAASMGDPNQLPQLPPQVAQTAPQPQPTQQVYPGLKRPPPAIGTTVNGYTYMGGDPRSQDPAVWKPASGDTFLNSLPLDDTKKTLIRGIANYELPPGSARGGLGSPEVQQLLGFAKQYDPSFDVKNFKARQDFIHDMNDAKTKDQIQTLTNAALHAKDFDSAYSKLNNWNAPPFVNNALNLIKGYGGDTAMLSNLGAAAQARTALGPESARVYKGAEPTVGELDDQKDNLNTGQAPALESGQMGDMASKFAQRLLTIQNSYKRAFGDQMPKQPLIDPHAAQAIHDLMVKYKPGYDPGLDYNTLTAGGFNPKAAQRTTGATPTQITPPNVLANQAASLPRVTPQANPQDIADELRRRGVIK